MPLPGSHQLALIAEAQALLEDAFGDGIASRACGYRALADLVEFGIEYQVPICQVRTDDWRDLAGTLRGAADRLGNDPAYAEPIPAPADWEADWLQLWADLCRKTRNQFAAELGDRDLDPVGGPLTDGEMVKSLWRVVWAVKGARPGLPRGRWLDQLAVELERWFLALGERHVSGSLGLAGVAYDPDGDTPWSMPS